MKNVLLKKTLPLLLLAPLFARNAHAFSSTVMMNACYDQTASEPGAMIAPAGIFFEKCSVQNIKKYIKKHPGMYVLLGLDVSLSTVYGQSGSTAALVAAGLTTVGGVFVLDMNHIVDIINYADQIAKDIAEFKVTGKKSATLEASTQAVAEQAAPKQLTTAERVEVIEQNLAKLTKALEELKQNMTQSQQQMQAQLTSLQSEVAKKSAAGADTAAIQEQIKDLSEKMQSQQEQINKLSARMIEISLAK
jgi:hypothetical protein